VPAPNPPPHRDPVEKFIETRQMRKGMRPRSAAYLIASFWLFAVVGFGVIERIADPKTFKTIWLAFWWAIQTVTTVGYGDIVPDQATGKLMAAFLMLGGLSLLSVVTATITSSFVARRQQEQLAAGDDPVQNELTRISEQLTTMQAELQEIRAQLGSGAGEQPRD
jgi:voltage-gated potassium channel